VQVLLAARRALDGLARLALRVGAADARPAQARDGVAAPPPPALHGAIDARPHARAQHHAHQQRKA
jgi:hypothetical protein